MCLYEILQKGAPRGGLSFKSTEKSPLDGFPAGVFGVSGVVQPFAGKDSADDGAR